MTFRIFIKSSGEQRLPTSEELNEFSKMLSIEMSDYYSQKLRISADDVLMNSNDLEFRTKEP